MTQPRFHSEAPLRIALIGPSFKPGLSYQENLWAEHLTRMGHSVRVFYADRATTLVQKSPGTASGAAYEIQPLASRFLPRGTYRSKELLSAVRDYQPQLLVIQGDKLFSKPVVEDPKLADVPLLATFSENLGMHEFDWRKPGISPRQRIWALGFRVLRAGPIRAVCRRADVIIGNTPQARGILLPLFDKAAERAPINAKLVDIPLGFSPDHFGYWPEVRRRVRAELSIADHEIVVCASSHFSAVKSRFILMIIEALRQAMDGQVALRGLIVGFSNAGETAAVSRGIADAIDRGPHAARFIKHDFAKRDRLAQLYNAADIAVFGRPSISCQEALGTGLVGCFANDGSMNHLVTEPDQGVFFVPNDRSDLAAKIADAARAIGAHEGPARDQFRQRLANGARWLGYDRIIERAMDELRWRVDAPAPAGPGRT